LGGDHLDGDRKSPDPVQKYAKLELTVALGGTYSNPYDPAVIDLSATFTSPSGKAWKVNGFYNGTQYLIRFAANETGNWTYTVSATDASGTATNPGGTFTLHCVIISWMDKERPEQSIPHVR
jgi:hypothetical protein